nr:Crp/Fnr family transcriptional regulator [Palleronia sp. THAF1]
MSEDELSFMESFKRDELSIGPGTPILMENARSAQMFTVLEGLAIRFKTLDDGRRQIINFVMPGDFIGLQAAVADEMGHSVEAVTDMTLCVFERAELFSIFQNHPSRAYDITWLGATEEHFLGEALTSIGQRSAIERIAWGLLNIWMRAIQLDLLQDGELLFPFRQQDLADTLGLSLVHTNKTLAKLRERGLLSWSSNRLALHDVPALEKLAVVSIEDFKRHRPLM